MKAKQERLLAKLRRKEVLRRFDVASVLFLAGGVLMVEVSPPFAFCLFLLCALCAAITFVGRLINWFS